MTNPNSEPPSRSNRRCQRWLRHPIPIALGTSLVVVGSGVWWAWVWIHNRLAPLIETNLEQLLDRPVELGDLRFVSPGGIRFDRSIIPATPTDPDQVTAEAVDVQFSPWQLLFKRTLQLQVTLIQPTAYIAQDLDGRWISTQLQSQEGGGFLKTDLQTIRFRDGTLVLQPLARPNVPPGRVTFYQVGGLTRFLDDNQQIQFNARGIAADAGRLQLRGEFRPEVNETDLTLQARSLAAVDVSRVIELPIALQNGRANGNLTINFRPEQEAKLTGQVDLTQVTAQIAALPQRFTNTQGRLQFAGNTIAFNWINTRYGTIPAQVNGTIHTEIGYALSALIRSVNTRSVLDTLAINSPFPVQGTIQAQLQLQGPLEQPVLTGTARTLNTAQIDRVPFQSIRTNFQLTTAEPAQLSFSQIRATPQAGGQMFGNGRITLADPNPIAFQFLTFGLPADPIAQRYGVSPDLRLGTVAATARLTGTSANLQTVVRFQAPNAIYPGSGEVVISDGNRVLVRDARFQVAEGTVQAQGQIADDRFQAVVRAAQVPLDRFSSQLRGLLNADLRVIGNPNQLELAAIRAEGQVRLSEGIAVIERPLTAQVRWTGQQLQIERATAPGLSATGVVTVRTDGETPEIGPFDLAVQTQGYPFADLGLNLPVALTGLADFRGRVTGTPAAPNVSGTLLTENLRVNGIAFESQLNGQLEVQADRQTTLQLTGTQDQIALSLSPNNQPRSFLIQRGQAIARGRSVGETLLVDLQDLPIALVSPLLPAAALENLRPIAGDLSGSLTVNLEPLTVAGTVTIVNAQLGRINADRVAGQIRYENGIASITAGEIQQGESLIVLNGQFQTTANQTIALQIGLDQARIENVLQTLSIFEFQDLASGFQQPPLAEAADVQPAPIEIANTRFINQLRRFSEITALLRQQQAQRQAEPLPPLAALQGRLSGSIAVSGSLQMGPEVRFDVQGQNWQWGQDTIENVVARGSFAAGTLTILPLRIELGRGLIAFSGQLAAEQLSGQLRVRELPIAQLRPFLQNIPLDLAGRLNATATLTGSLNNPNVLGEVTVLNGRLNNQPIAQTNALFGYENARLNFNSRLLLTGPEPLEILGSIPIALPFASVQPQSDEISLRANVRNEGLALLNVFTDQVRWIEGRGQLNVRVEGTLAQPIVQGSLTVRNATLQAQALADPLTNVTGTAQFNGDRLMVEQFRARYNQDRLTTAGILPIFTSPIAQQQAATNPLTIAFENLTLDLANLYQGDLAGNVTVTGALLAPVIGGTLQLNDGTVILADATADQTVAAAATPDDRVNSNSSDNIAFNNLQIILADDIHVVRQPILDFVAVGDLILNGTLANPSPAGTIRLTQGQVNLFTTQFRLAREYDQTATFIPDRGFDPILDVRLVALVPELNATRLSTAPGEIADTSTLGNPGTAALGTLRTIRVEAIANGPASELSQNLELTSTPPRTEAEIVALIGGNLLNTIGQSTTPLGIANLAGSVLLNNFQQNITALGQAIGLSELRITPAIVTDPATEGSTLSFAVEGVVDVTNNLSVSVAGVVAANDPIRYNAIYQINNQLRVRASTNLAGESQGSIEFQTRF